MFPIIVLAGVGVVVAALVLLARFYPGSGADVLDWRPSRSYETEVELEMEDVQQMIEAQNVYRRKRGMPELTEEEVRQSVARDKGRELSEGE
jgi:hypothetical protein